MAEAKLTAVIEAEDRASATLAKVGKSAEGLGKKIGDLKPMFSTMAVAGTAAFAVLGGVAVSALKEFADSQKLATIANKALGNTLEYMSEKQIDSLAKQIGVGKNAFEGLQHVMGEVGKTAISLGYDDDVARVAFAKLFQVSKDVTQAQKDMKLAMDLAAFSGRSLEESAAAITKVHGGATKILKEFGIEVKEGATSLDALNELQKVTGGTARNVSKTIEGQMNIMREQFANLKESIGGALVPVLQKLIEKITPAIEAIVEWVSNNPKLTATIFIVSTAVAGLVTALGLLGLAVIAFQAVSLPLVLTFSGIALVIAAVVAVGYLLYKNWESIKIIAADVWQYVVMAWNGIKNTVTSTMAAIEQNVIIIWESIKLVFTTAVAFLMGAVMVLLDWMFPAWETTLFAIYNKTIEIFTFLKTYFGSALEELRIRISDSLAIIKTVWTNVWTTMKSIFVSIWDSIAKIFDSVIDGITKGMEKLVSPIQKVITMAEKALSLAGGAVSSVKGKISSGISSILDRGKSALGIDDGIVQNGQIISTHPEDTIVAMKDWSKFGGGGKNININISGAILNEEAAKVMGDLIISQLRMQLKF